MALVVSRFKICKSCARNALEGFNGPPECEMKVVPAANGTCQHHTTEMAAVVPAAAIVTIGKPELVGALGILKQVAARSRFAGSHPIMFAVGPESLELRAVDGETDLLIAHGDLGATPKRTVVPLDLLLNEALGDGQVTLSFTEEGVLKVGENEVEGVEASTLPGPFDSGEFGAILGVPPLTESCTYLVRAISRDETRPTLRYILMEVPGFTFVATDGHRLHVQWTKPEAQRPRAGEVNVLLTKEQLALLWEGQFDHKQLAITNKGCVVMGRLGTLQVTMAFTTGTGQFPEWRTLLEDFDHSAKIEIGPVRKLIRGEGELFGVGDTVKVLKSHLSDVIVGWVDEEVEFKYKDAASPVLVNGSDRTAVVIHATEVPVEQPVVEGEVKMKKSRTKVKSVQTSARIPTEPVVQQYTVGQSVTTPEGAVEIQNARICYLVKMPDGKRRWFNQDGVNRMAAGQAVEEAANEAAA